MPMVCTRPVAWAHLWASKEGVEWVWGAPSSSEEQREPLADAPWTLGVLRFWSQVGGKGQRSPLSSHDMPSGVWAMGPGRAAGWPQELGRETVAGGRAHRKPGGPAHTAATCSSCSGRYALLPAGPPPARLLPAPASAGQET